MREQYYLWQDRTVPYEIESQLGMSTQFIPESNVFNNYDS